MAKGRKDQIEGGLVDTRNKENKGFFEANQMSVITAAAIILLIIGAFLAYQYLYKAPREKAAAEQIFKAEQQFLRDSFALALEAPGGGYDGLLDIVDNYGGTKTANLAKYYAGISYLNLGRFDDAVSYLDSYSPKGNITTITKYGAMGDAYSELGEMSKAINSYEKATSTINDALTPYYLYKLGILAQKEGDKSRALKAFKKISEDFPKSNEAIEAAKYIGMLK